VLADGLGGFVWASRSFWSFYSLWRLPWDPAQRVARAMMGGHAMLGTESCTRCCVLLERMFSSLRAALKLPAQPSGFVAGWSRSGAVSKLFVAGGFQGFDCVVAIVLWCFV
jgi:hypothetical protein